MRKTNLILVMIILLSSLTIKAANEFEKDGIKYHILDESSVEVINNDTLVVHGGVNAKISKYKGKIEVPEYVNNGEKTYKVVKIGPLAFEGASIQWGAKPITEVLLPNTIKYIGINAFEECPITHIDLPDSLIEIERDAFYKCGILDIVFPESLRYIGKEAFSESNLVMDRLIIPENVLEIEEEAFYNCHIKTIELNGKLKKIGEAALACCELLDFELSRSNEYFSVIDGVLYNANQTELVGFPSGRVGAYSVPEEVTSIGSYAFLSSNLDSISLPGVEMIGSHSFSSLVKRGFKISAPKLKTIKEYAFFASNIKSLDLPFLEKIEYWGLCFCGINYLNIPKIKNIGDHDFWSSNIKNIVFGPLLRSMQRKSFSVSDFESVTVTSENPKSIFDDVFNNKTYRYGVLRVPKGTKSIYESLDGWKNFENIEEFDPASGITDVENDGAVNLTWECNSSEITISNPTGGMVGVYDMTGRIVFIGTQETITVPYNPIYIIRQGNKSSKVYFPAY